MRILKATKIKKTYPLHGGFFAPASERVSALSDVSCVVEKGDRFGVVGKSGSGKSTLTRILLGQEQYDEGAIHYAPLNMDPCNCDPTALRRYRDEVKLIFQDPSKSLNARLTIGKQFVKSLWHSTVTKGMTRRQKYDFIYEKSHTLLKRIGLGESAMEKSPIYFSGGQRQRLAIVRALIHSPKVLICDEITSSLDVSTHRILLELLLELKEEFQLTILFIAHNLPMVFYFCNKVAVMNEGSIVEMGSTGDVAKKPQSPVTFQLLDASPQFSNR